MGRGALLQLLQKPVAQVISRLRRRPRRLFQHWRSPHARASSHRSLSIFLHLRPKYANSDATVFGVDGGMLLCKKAGSIFVTFSQVRPGGERRVESVSRHLPSPWPVMPTTLPAPTTPPFSRTLLPMHATSLSFLTRSSLITRQSSWDGN